MGVKAAFIRQTGAPSVIQVAHIPDPVTVESEVIVRIRAASLNHHDLYIRRGDVLGVPLPIVLGSDAAGEIVESFSDSGFRVGDRVVVFPVLFCGRCSNCVFGEPHKCSSMKMIGSEVNGTQSEFVRVPPRNLLKIPDSVSFESAACASLSGLTAWNMIVDEGKLQRGEHALVLGASGGVGMYVLSILRHLGVHVTAVTTQQSKIKLLQELGANDVMLANPAQILYRASSLTDGGFDVAFNWVGGPTWRFCPAAVRPGGRILTCGTVASSVAEIDMRQIFYRNVSIVGCTMGTPKAMTELLNLLAVEASIAQIPMNFIQLDDLPEAHRRMENREVIGKLVVRL